MTIDALVQEYGYWMVMAGTVFEGDATVISAAFLAHRGYLHLGWICAISAATTTVQNLVLYHLARSRGSRLLIGPDRKAAHLRKVLGWVQKRGALFLFASRFLVGLRTAAALACGVAEMPRVRFFWVNLVGAMTWSIVMAAIGWSGGHVFPALVADVKRHEWTAAGALALVVFLLVMWRSRGWDWRDLLSLFRRL